MSFLKVLLENHYETAAVILFGIGFMNLLISKNLIKKIIGFDIMDAAIFLFLASQGYINGRLAPIIVDGITDPSLYINPIPSSLVLTGIVVSVSVSAFSLALTQRIYKRYGTIELDELLTLIKKEED